MRGFFVPAGAQVYLSRQGTFKAARLVNASLDPKFVIRYTTKKDRVFFTEDIVMDPVGKIGDNRESQTFGGNLARAGWYGFKFEGSAKYDLVFIHMSWVKVG